MTSYLYPSLSNRVSTRQDSIVGTAGHSTQYFSYDASGSRLLHVKGVGTGVDSTYWQYDVLSRLVGTMRSIPGSPSRTRLEHFNECRWNASWRLAQPCGSSGQLSFVGQNVARSSLGWFFVQAPGIDETVLMVDRNGSWAVTKRLQSVTDGRGQLIAVGDSSGELTAPYAGSGYDQAAWQGGGLTSRAQTFDPRKWQTSMDWGGIQQFRNRAYDPGTGTWIQEDPIGVAGGVNLYQYSNANPASFSDPFGLDPCKDGKRGFAALICAVTLALSDMQGRHGVPGSAPIIEPSTSIVESMLGPAKRGARIASGFQTGTAGPSALPEQLAKLGSAGVGASMKKGLGTILGRGAIAVGLFRELFPKAQTQSALICQVEQCIPEAMPPGFSPPAMVRRP